MEQEQPMNYRRFTDEQPIQHIGKRLHSTNQEKMGCNFPWNHEEPERKTMLPGMTPSRGPAMVTCSPKVIGLCGLAGSGKSTIALSLRDEYSFEIVSMATGIKAMLRTLFSGCGISGRASEDMMRMPYKETPIDPEVYPAFNGKTPRQLLQTLGTEWGRACVGSSIWTEIAREAIYTHLRNGKSVVIDDLRFKDEVDMVHDFNGLVAYVVDTSAHVKPSATVHSSEKPHMLRFDTSVYNTKRETDIPEIVKAILHAERTT